MKLFFVLLLSTLSNPAFSQWRLPSFGNDSTGGLRAVWTCETNNRGEMPTEKEVEIYYDDFGKMKFRPDIFQLKSNPINEIRGLFGRKRGNEDVDQCLRTFLNTIPQAIGTYQRTQCEGLRIPTCSRVPEEILSDVKGSIRDSKFYDRYARELVNVTELKPETQLGSQTNSEIVTQPSETTPVVVVAETEDTPEVTETPERTEDTPERTETTVRPEVVVVPEKPEPTEIFRETIPRPQEDVDRARTRLLDYMTENASKIQAIKDFGTYCTDLGETEGVNANYCRHTMAYHGEFLTRLSQIFTAVRGEPVSVKRVVQSIECVPPSVSHFADIEGILRRLDKTEECAPLANVGDFKLFKKSHSPPSWYTSGNYLLKKTGADAYEATLVLDFQNSGGSATPEQMLASVKSCVGSANPYLRGPGGERISLRTLSQTEAESQVPRGERPKAEKINIQPDGIAIDSLNFTGNADCPTILHELLHHLGLCDEYRETRTNIVSGMTRSRAEEWSCRVVPNRTSIMKNHIEAFNTTVPQQFSCECQNDTCRNLLSASTPEAVAQKKLLLTASSGSILGMNAGHCVQTYLNNRGLMTEPDKAFTNVNVSGGRLSFLQKTVFVSGSQYLTSRSTVTCSCPTEDAGCPAAFARAAEVLRENPQADSCPYLMKPFGKKTAAASGANSSINPNSITIVTRPKNDSLLTPSHFDKILTGSCMTSPSSLFKECSEYAYVSQESPACASKPAACSDDNQVFGVTNQ